MSTIAAISTPAGIGGIGIVRISGEKACEIISKIFRPKTKGMLKSYQVRYGVIVNTQNEIIDEVLVSYFKAPKSYTGEDVCEISCHGGSLIVREILELVIVSGADLAKPGEFTKRAFLNGKMDLSQAEAVMDVIHSRSKKESQESMKQLQGFLSQEIAKIKGEILEVLVDIEANIDYPEYDIEEVKREKIGKVLEEAILKLQKLENSFEKGKILKEGIKTAIIGRPNVGKSSLLNAILKEERAIVTEIEGTTRDTIEEMISIQGIPLQIIDTAGIRETSDQVEEIGVNKSLKAMEEAQLILILVDAAKELSTEDKELLGKVSKKPHIVVINKIDLGKKIDLTSLQGEKVVEISAKEQIGMEELEKAIQELFELNQMEITNDVVITNLRHKNAVTAALQGIQHAKESLEMGLPMDMLSIDIQSAIQKLGEITGELVSEEVIAGIFQKFCLGK